VDYSAGSCACPLCCVFLVELGLTPFNLELTFTSFPLRSVGTSHTPSLTHCISHTLVADWVNLLASMWHRGQGITLWPTAGTPTPNNLRSNWDFLPGISAWHVGGSSIVNSFLGLFHPRSLRSLLYHLLFFFSLLIYMHLLFLSFFYFCI